MERRTLGRYFRDLYRIIYLYINRYKELMKDIQAALAPQNGEFGIAFEWADAQVLIWLSIYYICCLWHCMLVISCFDLIWFDLIWFDLIWFDLIWSGYNLCIIDRAREAPQPPVRPPGASSTAFHWETNWLSLPQKSTEKISRRSSRTSQWFSGTWVMLCDLDILVKSYPYYVQGCRELRVRQRAGPGGHAARHHQTHFGSGPLVCVLQLHARIFGAHRPGHRYVDC